MNIKKVYPNVTIESVARDSLVDARLQRGIITVARMSAFTAEGATLLAPAFQAIHNLDN